MSITRNRAFFLASIAVVTLVLPVGCLGDLTLDVNVNKATANSVWDFTATWTHQDGFWPSYMPDTDTELIQADPGATRVAEPGIPGMADLLEPERDVDDLRLGIKLGVNWRGDVTSESSATNDLQRSGYKLPPDPIIRTDTDKNGTPDDPSDDVTKITTETEQYYYLLPNLQGPSKTVEIKRGDKILSIVIDANGVVQQVYIPRHRIVRKLVVEVIDNGAPQNNSKVETITTIDCPPIIVPLFRPYSALSVNADPNGLLPIPAHPASAQSAICTRVIRTITTNNQGTTEEVSDPEKVVEPYFFYDVPIIVLDDTGDVPVELGNGGRNLQAQRLYVTYTRPGTNYIAVKEPSMPLPTWDYQVPATKSLDGSLKLKINTGILALDPNRTDPNDADPKDPTKPGINSPIIGVYDSNGNQCFVPGNYSVETSPAGATYGVIRIPPEKVPADFVDNSPMTVRVSTFAVDGVYRAGQESTDPRYPRRINYFRQPEWMTGVVTGTTRDNAFTVTPDIDPRAVDMRAVTGIYLPQIMSGRVVNKTRVIPADPSRLKSVLAVYALSSSENNTILDQTHVVPANAEQISFVSAVYGIATMPASPIGPLHVTPADPASISRVRKVMVDGQDTYNDQRYYDPEANPFVPGDTSITLNQPLQPGTVTIEYESLNLYDPDNPELAFRPGDTDILLNNPVPKGCTRVRVVYGTGTGLDGKNYYDLNYDPNDPNYDRTKRLKFQPGENYIDLKEELPSDCTDVRILYATDQELETRGVFTDAYAAVTTPTIWSVGQVKALYAIKEMEATKTGNKAVTPKDPYVIHDVMGVYPILTQGGDPVDNDPLRVRPKNPLAIRRVDAVTAVADQTGVPLGGGVVTGNRQAVMQATATLGTMEGSRTDEMTATVAATGTMVGSRVDVMSATRSTSQTGTKDDSLMTGTRVDGLHVTPADASVIRRVYGVYVNPDKSGTNYYDVNNPNTKFKRGDLTITLKTALPAGVNTVYIDWGQRVTPSNLPEVDQVLGVFTSPDLSGTNYYNPNDTDLLFESGDAQIHLSTALPAGTTTVYISYYRDLLHVIPQDPSAIVTVRGVYANPGLVGTNYYDPNNSETAFEPGDTVINLATPLPPDMSEAYVEYEMSTTKVKPQTTTGLNSVIGVYDNAELTGTNYYDAANPYNPGDAYITLTTPVSPELTQVYIKYGADRSTIIPADASQIYSVGMVYDNPEHTGTNYYDPNNPDTVFNPGDSVIKLKQEVPAGIDTLYVVYRHDTVHVKPERPDLIDAVLGVYDNAAMTGTNYYDPNDPNIAWHPGDSLITLKTPVAAGLVKVYIRYGYDDKTVTPTDPGVIDSVSGVYDNPNLTGTNYYNPNNSSTAFKPGDSIVKLATALPNGVTSVWVSYQMDRNHVRPLNAMLFDTVVGVYDNPDRTGTNYYVNPTTGNPDVPYVTGDPWIVLSQTLPQGVNTVYITYTPENRDPLRVVPNDPNIIGRVFGVFDNAAKTGVNYFDPNNPETTFRPGDTRIVLSTPLPSGVETVYINYETTNRGGDFTRGDSTITLDHPLPANPQSITVSYVDNANLYNRNKASQRFKSGDTQITLDNEIPEGVVRLDVAYAEALDRSYQIYPDNSAFMFAPGETSIPVFNTTNIAGATGALVKYNANLFSRFYDPVVDYNPDNPATWRNRPFIPGDTTVRLNKLDDSPDAPGLPEMFTRPGAVKLCIAYQSSAKVPMGTYSNGRLYLPIPLPEPKYVGLGSDGSAPYVQLTGKEVFVDYRSLSNASSNGTPGGTYTVSRPFAGRVISHSLLPGDHGPDFHTPLPQISDSGRFTAVCQGHTPGTPALFGASAFITYRRQEPTAPTTGYVWLNLQGGRYAGRIPMYYVEGSPRDGAKYKVAVSAGLNMSNPLQWPSLNLEENTWTPENNRLLFDSKHNPMWYAPDMVADGDKPRTLSIRCTGYYYEDTFKSQSNPAKSPEVTIHDSYVGSLQGQVDHAGHGSGKDYLLSYTYDRLDPLSVEPRVWANPTYPDDGSSSHEFVFRVRYKNRDALPPLPWLPWYGDPWMGPWFTGSPTATGVVLYLDKKGTGDYQPHFMRPENPDASGDGSVWMYHIFPHHDIAYGVTLENGGSAGSGAEGGKRPAEYPMPRNDYWNNNNYASLLPGNYRYFFACADDSLKFADGSFLFDHQPDISEWGGFWTDSSFSTTPLDPSFERSVTGYAQINRPANRRYSSDGISEYDGSLYVDRPVLVPGAFTETNYPLSADSHPRVTCGLVMPPVDDLNVPYDDFKYGNGRFFGTIAPFYHAYNPLYNTHFSMNSHWESLPTCGTTTKTDHVFRIVYMQVDNKPPISIRVFINNAGEKTGSGPNYAYTGYTMYPREDQTKPYNYRNGVWYEYKTKLPPGPHTYYFEAYDGEHTARFPVRPDKIVYDNKMIEEPDKAGCFVDWWVPTFSTPAQRGTSAYIDNDYFPGPYVNNPCQLSDPSVTPGTGKEGQRFQYKVKYTDPDGQAPFSAFIYIETNNRGDIRRFSMKPEIDLVPGQDNSQYFKNGINYVLDTATLSDFALENGVRRYYFEFTDDWGNYRDVNSRIQGETTRYPDGAGNWISGPIISSNVAPTLTNGSVESLDGTANAATIWTFRVTYKDVNNDPPALIKVYIGLLQPDGRTILWDDGHTLTQTNHADTVYSDGADFSYQTRLGAADSDGRSKQYFYAFVAYDGFQWATYNWNPGDDTHSDAANCLIGQALTKLTEPNNSTERNNSTELNKVYKIKLLVVQQGRVTRLDTGTGDTFVAPDNWEDLIIKPTPDTTEFSIEGVYDNANLVGENYFVSVDERYKRLQIKSSFPADKTIAWIRYEPQAPCVGPLPIDLPAPAGVIPDDQLFENASSNPIPLLIDDQKNGWISADNPEDRGVVTMSGTASHDGAPSLSWVQPDYPRDIASVEGVYLDSDMSGTNYYDRSKLEPIMWRDADVDPNDEERKTIIVPSSEQPSKVLKVLGVYTTKDATGTNYYLGEGYPDNPKWQDAFVVGSSTVWPKDPNDIVTIKGVYTGRDTSLNNYYSEDIRSVQYATASKVRVQPTDKSLMKKVTGVYLTQPAQGQQPTGTNYYDEDKPWNPNSPDSNFVDVKPLPKGYSTVYIRYLDAQGTEQWQPGTVYVSEVDISDPQGVSSLEGIYISHEFDAGGKLSGVGVSYYDSGYDSGDDTVVLTTPIMASAMPANGRLSVIYDRLPNGFGPYGEYIGLREFLTTNFSTSFVSLAYYSAGSLKIRNKDYILKLSKPLPPDVDKVKVRVIARSFNCGDTEIPLTTDLPVSWTTAQAAVPFTVIPANLADIGFVVGVYTSQDTKTTNYYDEARNPFRPGDAQIRTTQKLSGTVYVAYAPRNRRVTIKYSDIRFTHQLRGSAHMPVFGDIWRTGNTHYSPDGWSAPDSTLRWMVGTVRGPKHVEPADSASIEQLKGVYLVQDETATNYYTGTDMTFYTGDRQIVLGTSLPGGTTQVHIAYYTQNVHIKGNQTGDIDGGTIGVWTNPSRDGANYFNPRAAARYADNPKHLRLTTPVPEGTGFLWARYYQKGEYHIDRWNRQIHFLNRQIHSLTDKPESSAFQANLFFGTRMPRAVEGNTPPTLEKADVTKQAVTPISGSRSTQYTYTIVYKDPDGPNGQAPTYVRVYIDGTPYDMTPVNAGTPAYRDGAVYRFTTSALSGGSHKYHFEASDGAAIAWFDANGAHQATGGSGVGSVVELDGPWVNNPPELTEGAAAPNPTSGGINAWESVDYTVKYKDIDNDAPYFYDAARDIDNTGQPVGADVSGSPRVWIDSPSTGDVSYSGVVSALEVDPLEPAGSPKYRTIVAQGTPGWTSDQFAGKLLQITNGALAGRVYLIQSNTSNKLVLATNDLKADGVQDAASGTPSRFIINGLLMSKADPTQQDYTAGVTFKLTVPRLAVGTHKFHFTARSREDKPTWLKNLEAAEGQTWTPYSIEVRNPLSGDYNGPTVINTPPPGNSAPVLTTTADASLHVGPMVQPMSVVDSDSLARIDATKFANAREFLAAYLNADLTGTRYTIAGVTSTGLELGENIMLTPEPELVQSSLAIGSDLLTVTPDDAASIGAVLKVCTDKAMQNDYFTIDGGPTGTFDGSHITLAKMLPVGTEAVYIQYRLKSGMPLPAVAYAEYFGVAQSVYRSGEPLTFRVKYRDTDNDPPRYHDGVQGYIKLVFNETNTSALMLPLDPSATDYTTDKQFTLTLTDVPEGRTKYHFEASDGYQVTRFPQGVLGDPAANDYTLVVNYKPVLSLGSVSPSTGQTATKYTFTVTYKDTDGDAAGKPTPTVWLRLVKKNGGVFGPYQMARKSTSGTYANGVEYTYSVPSAALGSLEPGTYTPYFEASDGYQAAVPFEAVPLVVRDNNTRPQVLSCSFSPAAGKTKHRFTFKATYRDADNDAPIATFGGQRLEALKLTIGSESIPMLRSSAVTPDYSKPTGEEFTADVYGNKIKGHTTYKVTGSDDGVVFFGPDLNGDGVEDEPLPGPVLTIPYFDLKLTTKTGEPVLGAARVGQQAVLIAKMRFPYNTVTGSPGSVSNIVIQLTKPDRSVITLGGRVDRVELVGTSYWEGTVTVNYGSGVDPALATGDCITFTSSGEWRIGAVWAGDDQWDVADTGENPLKIMIGAPMRGLAVANSAAPDTSSLLVDMITPPMIIGSTDVGAIFGYDRALQMNVVRWDPAAKAYFRYGAVGPFPALLPGDAVWILPKSSYPTEVINSDPAAAVNMVNEGWVTFANPDVRTYDPNFTKSYRLAKVFVKDYTMVPNPTTGQLEPAPCVIQLKAGWNQIGNIFFNWRRAAPGAPVYDAGIPVSEIKVRYLNQEKSLADAKSAGWTRDYLWRYDPINRRYNPVSSTMAGAERVLKAWYGYWIRAFVDCQLIIPSTTTYEGSGTSTSTGLAREQAQIESLEQPPPVPGTSDK